MNEEIQKALMMGALCLIREKSQTTNEHMDDFPQQLDRLLSLCCRMKKTLFPDKAQKRKVFIFAVEPSGPLRGLAVTVAPNQAEALDILGLPEAQEPELIIDSDALNEELCAFL